MDKRLQAALSLYTPGEWGADIGTDHGFLPCAVLEQGICQRMIAADLRPAALEKAKREAQRRGLSDRIRFVLADGMAALDRTVSCVSITGLGGRNIAEILKQGMRRLGKADLVLCAHTDLPVVRRCLQQLGWMIDQELIVFSQGRYYLVWKARPGLQHLTDEELELGTAALYHQNSPELLAGYLRWRLDVESAHLRGLRAGAHTDQMKLHDQETLVVKLQQHLGGVSN